MLAPYCVVVRCQYGTREVRGQAHPGRTRPVGASGAGWQESGQSCYAGPHPAQDSEGWSAPKVAQALDVAGSSVHRIKRRFAEDGLDGVLKDRPQANRYRKLDDRAGAYLIALACTPAPDGYDHWTLRALAGKAVELGLVESLSHESVRRHLKKTPSSRGRGSSGAFPR